MMLTEPASMTVANISGIMMVDTGFASRYRLKKKKKSL